MAKNDLPAFSCQAGLNLDKYPTADIEQKQLDLAFQLGTRRTHAPTASHRRSHPTLPRRRYGPHRTAASSTVFELAEHPQHDLETADQRRFLIAAVTPNALDDWCEGCAFGPKDKRKAWNPQRQMEEFDQALVEVL